MPRFPVSDHCDGERFFNPTGPGPRPFSDVWKWQRERARGSVAAWPDRVPPPRRPQLPASIRPGEVATTFIGHATFLLQFATLNVLTDPVFAAHAGPLGWFGPKRARPAALSLAELPRIDVVLLSHNHYDHLDVGALRWLARERQPLFVVPLGLKTWLHRRGLANVVELDWWQEHRLATADTGITCTPAQHWSSRYPWDRGRTLWGGFLLRVSGRTVYFAGDSGWGTCFAQIGARLGAPDLALLPIGAYEPRWFMESVHMNPDEAVRAHLALGAQRSIGMHFGTFQLTDEAIDEPLRALAAARTTHGVAAATFDTLDFGETQLVSLATGS